MITLHIGLRNLISTLDKNWYATIILCIEKQNTIGQTTPAKILRILILNNVLTSAFVLKNLIKTLIL